MPVIAFSSMFADLVGYSLPDGTGWISPLFGTVVFVYGGAPFLRGAVDELRARLSGMMLLIGLAITVAYMASLATSVHLGDVDLDFWWELALLIDVMLLGHWVEMNAIGQAQGAVAAVAALLPDEAERVSATGDIDLVGIGALRPGDVVRVRAGARVPADGIVTDGEAAFDESMITGESRPVGKRVGEPVIAGTVSTDSAVRVQTLRWARTPRSRGFDGSSKNGTYGDCERCDQPIGDARLEALPTTSVCIRCAAGRS